MAFQTADGAKAYGSKFRASRYNRENANPDAGARSEAHDLTGNKGGYDSRLHNNPHPEKFNTPLHAPGQSDASADPQEMGEEQAEAHDAHSVTCPECGAEVPVDGAGGDHADKTEAPMSDTEHDVENDKVAKGVWKPGQREHPDAENVPDRDDFHAEPL